MRGYCISGSPDERLNNETLRVGGGRKREREDSMTIRSRKSIWKEDHKPLSSYPEIQSSVVEKDLGALVGVIPNIKWVGGCRGGREAKEHREWRGGCRKLSVSSTLRQGAN